MTQTLTQPYGYALLALLAGLGIPVMAAMNAHLGLQLQSTALSTVVLFAVGLGVSSLYLLLIAAPAVIPPTQLFATPQPPLYLFSGGIFVAFYIFTITWISPRFGVANAIVFVLLGQMVSAVIIDHFGLFNAIQVDINLKKILGILLMIAGIFLVKRAG
jgi:bacterial/archaeal transporter family-2 protein